MISRDNIKKNVVPLFCALCIAIMCLCSVCPAEADSNLSITIEYSYGSTVISGAEFKIYRAAVLSDDMGFMPTEDFQKYSVSFDNESDEEWRRTAAALDGYIARDGISAYDTCTTDYAGNAAFPNARTELEPGLYLIIGSRCRAGSYYYTPEPFFITLPGAEGNSVAIKPKSERTARPTTSGGGSYFPPFNTSTNPAQTPNPGPSVSSEPFSSPAPEQEAPTAIPETPESTGSPETPESPGSPGSPDSSGSASSSNDDDSMSNSSDSDPNSASSRTDSSNANSQNGINASEITAVKSWKDGDNVQNRPKSIEVQLLRDGEIYDTIALNAAGNWRHTWSGLDEQYAWRVVENNVPSGYTFSLDKEGTTFILVNTDKDAVAASTSSGRGQSSNRLPQTGQLKWPIPFLAAGGMLLFIFGFIRYRDTYDEKII